MFLALLWACAQSPTDPPDVGADTDVDADTDTDTDTEPSCVGTLPLSGLTLADVGPARETIYRMNTTADAVLVSGVDVLYRSVDGALTWEVVPLDVPRSWLGPAISTPGDPDTLHVSTSKYGVSSLVRSTDGGSAWSTFLNAGDDLHAMLQDPLDPDRIWGAGPTGS